MRFSTLILLTLPIHIAAQSPVLQYDTLYAAQNPALAGNPALYGLRQPCSLSEISVGFSRSIFDKAAIAEQGKDCGIASFDAATYLHAGKATITGFATYANGKIFGVQGSETSDATLLYPYYSADERGGDFKHERYVFGDLTPLLSPRIGFMERNYLIRRCKTTANATRDLKTQ